MRYLNYINGGSFFESVENPVGGKFKIYYEADDDPDPDVSKSEDDDNPEVSDSNDDENPEVSTSDDNDSSTSTTSSSDDDNDSTSDNDTDNSSSDDTSNDDSSDSSDSNGDQDDNDSSSSSSDNDDSNSEDGSNDMDSDPHSVSGDDEDPDASSSSDDDSSDKNDGKDDDKKEDKPGTDFENMRRYNLYKKFMSLSDSINGYTDTLDALVYDDDTLNTVTKITSQKLKQLSEIMYDYMTMKFENDSYTQALLFYHEINAGVRMCFDLLESGNANIHK